MKSSTAETARSAQIPIPFDGRFVRCGSEATATLHEERRELFDSVLLSMRAAETDDDCAAACTALLHHLASTAIRY